MDTLVLKTTTMAREYRESTRMTDENELRLNAWKEKMPVLRRLTAFDWFVSRFLTSVCV